MSNAHLNDVMPAKSDTRVACTDLVMPADLVELLAAFRAQHRRCGVLLERETPRYTILRCAPCRMGVWQRRLIHGDAP